MIHDPNRSRPVVAIVDDEEDITTYLELALSDHGIDVIACTDSASSYDVLVENAPDLILLDLIMPGQTGVALYAKISRHPRLASCPIVIMSGLCGSAEIASILDEHCDLHQPPRILEKPIDVGTLLEVVGELLEDTRGAA